MNINFERAKKGSEALISDKGNFPNGLMFLTLGGSYAFDTYIDNSDIDIRGVAFNTNENILYLKDNQKGEVIYTEKEKDIVVYYFNKYAKLLYSSNPNIIELLGTSEDKILYKDPIFDMILDNKEVFLSRQVFYTFGKYAEDQLRRAENSLMSEDLSQSKKEERILSSVRRQLEDTMSMCSEKLNIGEEIKLYIDLSTKTELQSEIFIDANFEKYPLRDFSSAINTMLMAVNRFGKVSQRNKKKSDKELEKHFMHLIRTIKMATEILSGKGILTSRKEAGDLDFLMSIRNGEISFEDLFLIANKLIEELNYTFNNSCIQDKINEKDFKEIIMTMNRYTLTKHIN